MRETIREHERPRLSVAPSMAADADAGPTELDRATAFLVRNWLVIAVAAVLGALAGFFGARLLTKVYRAEVLLTPVHEDNSPMKSAMAGLGAIASLAGVELGKGEDQTSEFLATLTSRVLLEQFIADRDLLPVLFPKRWDPAKKAWRSAPGVPTPTLQDGYYAFSKGIMSVIEDKQTGLITVRVDWRDPIQGASWANELVSRVNQEARTRTMHNADLSIEYLNKELQQTQAIEIRASIFSVLESQINKRMMAATRPDFAFRVIDPAQAAQRNRFVRPIPLLLAGIGLFSGGLLGMIAAVVGGRLRAGKG
jgi:uncharacterized protein involved in exopolysaccharide biosynthesis